MNIYSDEVQGAVRVLVGLGVSRTAALRTWDCRYRQSFRGANPGGCNIEDSLYWKHPRNAGQLVGRKLLIGRTWHEFSNRPWWKLASAREKVRIGRVLSGRIFASEPWRPRPLSSSRRLFVETRQQLVRLWAGI